MLGLPSHPAAHLFQVRGFRRADFAEVARIWRGVAAASASGARIEAEVQVKNQLVVALEGWSTCRADHGRSQAAQEVRLMAQGVRNGGMFPEVRGAVWRPDASVMGSRAGDRIRLNKEVSS